MKKTTAGLNIKAVAERTGVSLHTLRAWERRYGVPRPARVPGNRYRVYDEQDIADVLWMKRQVEAGVSPGQASAMLRAQGRRLPGRETAQNEPIAATQAALLTALLASDQVTSEHILDEAWAQFSLEQIVRRLIQPTMTEIGRLWMSNQITVGQEHFASNLVRQRLLAVLHAQPALPVTSPRLVAACAPAEQHELGLLLFTLLARRSGWQVLYLGQRTPLADLARSAESYKLIVLSASTVNGLASLIPLWLKANRPAATLVFGGLLFEQLPPLREHIPGAYLGDDVVEAVRTLATSNLRAVDWKPAPGQLDAALVMQERRLVLAEATLRGMAEKTRVKGHRASAHNLVDPTLFLIDAMSSALAFDVPELMNLQGAWLGQLLSAHGVNAQALALHLESFQEATQELLAPEHGPVIEPLLERLSSSTGMHSNGSSAAES